MDSPFDCKSSASGTLKPRTGTRASKLMTWPPPSTPPAQVIGLARLRSTGAPARADVARLEEPVGGELVLEADVPLLHVGRAQIPINGAELERLGDVAE